MESAKTDKESKEEIDSMDSVDNLNRLFDYYINICTTMLQEKKTLSKEVDKALALLILGKAVLNLPEKLQPP